MLQAFSILRQGGANCRLEILGIGELKAELTQMAQDLGVAEVCGLSEAGAATSPDFLSGIDALVLSSVSEGLPLTVLEAMAAGKPVVATAVGGVPGGHPGMPECGMGFCEPSNPQQLAAAMLRAMNTACAQEKGARGRQQAIQRYSADRMASQYHALFYGAAGRQRDLVNLSNSSNSNVFQIS